MVRRRYASTRAFLNRTFKPYSCSLSRTSPLLPLPLPLPLAFFKCVHPHLPALPSIIGYVCSQLVGAHFGGVFGPAKLLGAALFGWSLLTLLTPFAARTSPRAMVLTRVCLGLLEGSVARTFLLLCHRYPCCHLRGRLRLLS